MGKQLTRQQARREAVLVIPARARGAEDVVDAVTKQLSSSHNGFNMFWVEVKPDEFKSNARGPAGVREPARVRHLLMIDPDSADESGVTDAGGELSLDAPERLLRLGPACLRVLAELADEYRACDNDDDRAEVVEEARLQIMRAFDHAKIPEVGL